MDRSRYTLPSSPRQPAVTAVRFVETSVSGKRDWTTEGNVQEIKLSRRVEQKQVQPISRHCRCRHRRHYYHCRYRCHCRCRYCCHCRCYRYHCHCHRHYYRLVVIVLS